MTIIDKSAFLHNVHDLGIYDLDVLAKSKPFHDWRGQYSSRTAKYTTKKLHNEDTVIFLRISDFILNTTVKIHPSCEEDAVTNGWGMEIFYNNETVYKKIDIFESSANIDCIIPITIMPFVLVQLKVTLHSKSQARYYLTQDRILVPKDKRVELLNINDFVNELAVKSDGGFLGPTIQKIKGGYCKKVTLDTKSQANKDDFILTNSFLNGIAIHKTTEIIKGAGPYEVKRGFGIYDVVTRFKVKIAEKHCQKAIENGWKFKIGFNGLIVYSSNELHTNEYTLDTCILTSAMPFTKVSIHVEINDYKINDDYLYTLTTSGSFLSKCVLNRLCQLNIKYHQQLPNSEKVWYSIIQGTGGLQCDF